MQMSVRSSYSFLFIWEHLFFLTVFFVLLFGRFLKNIYLFGCIGSCGPPWWLSSKESACNTEDAGSVPGSGSFPGGGHGSPLQYSCLGNPMDRGAWRATIHRATQSHTRLKWLGTRAGPILDTEDFLCKGPDSNYFSFSGPDNLCHNSSTLLLQQQYINEWVWLRFNKTLFTQTGGGLAFARRPQFADAWLRLVAGRVLSSLTQLLTRSRTSSNSLRKDDMGDGCWIPGKRLWFKPSCMKAFLGCLSAEVTVHCWSTV